MNMTMAQAWSVATNLCQGRSDFASSELSLLYNLAYQEVATRIKYNGLESVATSTLTTNGFRIALPDDFSHVINLSNLSYGYGPTDLIQTDPATFDSASTYSGTPRYYGLFSSWLEIHPSLDTNATFQLRYVKVPETVVSSSSTPAIQARWHPGIAYKLAEMMMAARNDLDGEAVCRARYLSFMGSTPSDLALRQQAKTGMRVTLRRDSR